MTLRWIEGFETRQHFNFAERVYSAYAGTGFTSTSTGRKHGAALLGTNNQFNTRALVGSVQNTWIYQFAVRKLDDTTMSSTVVFSLNNSIGEQLAVHLVEAAAPNAGSFRAEIRRGATVLATSARVFNHSETQKGWWVFQLQATVRTGTDGAYELKAWDWLGNVSTIISLTSGVNTANQGTDGADRVTFRNASSANFYLDDIVVMDSNGSVNNDFTSTPLIVYGELPNADVGGELDWVPSTGTAHFSLVSDGATVPSGTGEVTSDVVGDVDLYGFSQTELDLIPTGAPPTVAGIMVDVEALMKNSGTRTVRVRFKDSSNQADDTTDLVFSDTAKISRLAVLEQNPTGVPAAWTVATLKTIELGPKNNA
jgi:hypothetical protein